MAALAAARDTVQYGTTGPFASDFYPAMKASTTIYQGALVVLDGTTGLAEPATAAASKTVLGVALETKTSGGSGTTNIRVRRGVWKFLNKGGDLVDATLINKDCYIEDDQTVRKTSTSSSAAGRAIRVDTDGVVVETYSSGS